MTNTTRPSTSVNEPNDDVNVTAHRENEPTKLKQTTLVYVFNPEGQVLMAVKKSTKSGFDVALEKVNAAGGKQKDGETIREAALRELQSEFGAIASEGQLIDAGVIRFVFETKKEWDNECHVYKIMNYTGKYKDSTEMQEVKYFDVDNLPWEKMWESDTYRMPKMLRGETLDETFYHTDEGKVIKHN